MDALDPYRPPRAQLDVVPSTDVGTPWRIEGTTLIIRNRARLPDICVRTGEPATRRTSRELSWTPVWFKILALVATLIALLTYSTIRRTATVDFAMTDATARRRTRGVILGVSAVVATAILLSLPGLRDPGARVLILFLGVALTTVGVLFGRPFRILKIDRFHARLRVTPGAAQEFARAYAASQAVDSKPE